MIISVTVHTIHIYLAYALNMVIEPSEIEQVIYTVVYEILENGTTRTTQRYSQPLEMAIQMTNVVLPFQELITVNNEHDPTEKP